MSRKRGTQTFKDYRTPGGIIRSGSFRNQKHQAGRADTVLITGGAGFIGTNLARRLLAEGRPVLVLDNLGRPGVAENLRALATQHGRALQFELADVRDSEAVNDAVRRATQVFHFAAQVAVTTSLADPATDFDVNLRGTFNLLEALRAQATPPPLIYTSTNKVYGNLSEIPLKTDGERYQPCDSDIARYGIGERQELSFHSPYGCSKGAADQYVLDYARCYGLPTAVVRMSCIYGTHQRGTEDQGWIAHFLLRTLKGRPITIYGDGRQVRDVLFVEDLIDALLALADNIDHWRGEVFNLGGGPANAISLLELVGLIDTLFGIRPELHFAPWRTGDQKFYVSDVRKAAERLGWAPRTPVSAGLAAAYEWLQMHDPRGPRYNRTASAQSGGAL